MKRNLLILLSALIIISCKQLDNESVNFEKKLIRKIEQKSEQFIQTEKIQFIDFKEITLFDWDYFKYISGNESVKVLKDEIKCSLNLNFETTDLEIYKSRFYFFKSNELVKEFDINYDRADFSFSNPCSNNMSYSNKFILTAKSYNSKSLSSTIHQICKRSNYRGDQLIKYTDYTYLVSALITKDNGRTYEYNTASQKLIDSIGLNVMFNKEIKTIDGKTQVSFDIIEDRILSQNNFFKVINDTIVVKPDFYLNCYDKSEDNLIYHCEIGFKRKDIQITNIKI